MLNSVLKDAIKKRDETLSILKGPKFEKIIKHIDAKVTLEDNQNYRILLDQLTLLIKNYDQLVFNTFA